MFELRPVGHVVDGRTDRDNTDYWGDSECAVELDPSFGEAALVGLEEFSHVEILFVFDRTTERDDYTSPRSPRGRADLPQVGVFCDRGPRRPNRIGSTVCRVVRVGTHRLVVRGLDALDGTPVIDIKPVMRQFLPDEVDQPGWVDDLMSEYFAPASPSGS